jgi:hypothetical protein
MNYMVIVHMPLNVLSQIGVNDLPIKTNMLSYILKYTSFKLYYLISTNIRMDTESESGSEGRLELTNPWFTT